MRSTLSNSVSNSVFATVFVLSSYVSLANADVNKVGNGGNAVVCETATEKVPEKVRLLDFYEMKSSSELQTYGTKDTAATYEQIVDKAIDRIAEASAPLGAAYRNRWKEFPQQIEWITDKKLVKVDDSLHTEEPVDETCKVQQLAIRQDKISDGEKRFQIRKDLWDQLSPTGKAGLALHEMLYQHFSRLGEKDSRSVRRVNRLLFSKDFDSKKFWKLIKDLRLPIYPG